MEAFDDEPLEAVQNKTMTQAARACATLRNAVNPLLFRTITIGIDGHIELGEQHLHAVLAQVVRHAKNLIIQAAGVNTDQELLELALIQLRHSQLVNFRFKNVVVDYRNEEALHELLSGEGSIYESLRYLALPCCNEQVALLRPRSVADCKVTFEFIATKLENEPMFTIMVKGQNSDDGPTRGAPTTVLPRANAPFRDRSRL